MWPASDHSGCRAFVPKFGFLCLQNARQTGRWPPNHPLAWLQEELDDITEDRRRELVEHGFPGKLWYSLSDWSLAALKAFLAVSLSAVLHSHAVQDLDIGQRTEWQWSFCRGATPLSALSGFLVPHSQGDAGLGGSNHRWKAHPAAGAAQRHEDENPMPISSPQTPPCCLRHLKQTGAPCR